MLYGIDFSFGSGLTTAQIIAGRKSFVGRYVSGGNSKDVSAAELANYKAAGIAVILFFETTGTDMTSYANGVRDAQTGQAQLTQMALANSDTTIEDFPLFFAADEQVELDETDYLKGAASIVGLARTGLYGGLQSIQSAFNQGLITYGCQTYAWSGGIWDNRALLRQYQNGVSFGPATVDLESAAYWGVASPVLDLTCDFGQWPRPTAAQAPPAGLPAYGIPEIVSVTPYGSFNVGVNAPQGATASTMYHYQVADVNGNTVIDDRVPAGNLHISGLKAPGTYKIRICAGADNGHQASPWSGYTTVSV
jgi:hypothetical protein